MGDVSTRCFWPDETTLRGINSLLQRSLKVAEACFHRVERARQAIGTSCLREQLFMVSGDLKQAGLSFSANGIVSRLHDAILTTVLICFVTSSIPKFSFEMATEMSSFARGSDVFMGIDLLVCCVCGRYSSPARIELAYSFGSKSGFAKIA